jgi:hypothetical protein
VSSNPQGSYNNGYAFYISQVSGLWNGTPVNLGLNYNDMTLDPWNGSLMMQVMPPSGYGGQWVPVVLVGAGCQYNVYPYNCSASSSFWTGTLANPTLETGNIAVIGDANFGVTGSSPVTYVVVPANSWNILAQSGAPGPQGPALTVPGPQGPAGLSIQGPSGPTGPQGPAGSLGTTVYTTTVLVPSIAGGGTQDVATLSLPQGFYLIDAAVMFNNASQGQISQVDCIVSPTNNADPNFSGQANQYFFATVPASYTGVTGSTTLSVKGVEGNTGSATLHCDAYTPAGPVNVVSLMMTATPTGALSKQ